MPRRKRSKVSLQRELRRTKANLAGQEKVALYQAGQIEALLAEIRALRALVEHLSKSQNP